MKTLSKKLMSLFLALTMVFSLSVPAFASSPLLADDGVSDNIPHQPIATEIGLTDQTISKADKYIVLNNAGLFEISDYDGLSQKLTTDELQLVEKQIKSINREVSRSVNASSGNTVIKDSDSKSVTIYSSLPTPRSAKEGVDKIKWKWFGIRIYLSKTTVNHIINAGVTAGATYLGIQFPGVGTAIASAVGAYLITEFGTSHISRAIYIDVGLKFPNLINPGIVGVRGYGLQ